MNESETIASSEAQDELRQQVTDLQVQLECVKLLAEQRRLDCEDFLEEKEQLERDIEQLRANQPPRSAPQEPTEEMWGGLARDIVMWLTMDGPHYGSKLHRHLEMLGKDIPQWLRDEIPDIDHTPPKGTMAVCVYKAMVAAQLPEAPHVEE